MLFDEAERGEVVDDGAVERGLGVEVEVGQAPGRRQAGEAEPAREPALFGRGHLDPEEPFEQGGVRQLLLARLLELGRKRLGGRVETEVVQVLAQLLVARLCRAHRAASA